MNSMAVPSQPDTAALVRSGWSGRWRRRPSCRALRCPSSCAPLRACGDGVRSELDAAGAQRRAGGGDGCDKVGRLGQVGCVRRPAAVASRRLSPEAELSASWAGPGPGPRSDGRTRRASSGRARPRRGRSCRTCRCSGRVALTQPARASSSTGVAAPGGAISRRAANQRSGIFSDPSEPIWRSRWRIAGLRNRATRSSTYRHVLVPIDRAGSARPRRRSSAPAARPTPVASTSATVAQPAAAPEVGHRRVRAVEQAQLHQLVRARRPGRRARRRAPTRGRAAAKESSQHPLPVRLPDAPPSRRGTPSAAASARRGRPGWWPGRSGRRSCRGNADRRGQPVQHAVAVGPASTPRRSPAPRRASAAPLPAVLSQRHHVDRRAAPTGTAAASAAREPADDGAEVGQPDRRRGQVGGDAGRLGVQGARAGAAGVALLGDGQRHRGDVGRGEQLVEPARRRRACAVPRRSSRPPGSCARRQSVTEYRQSWAACCRVSAERGATATMPHGSPIGPRRPRCRPPGAPGGRRRVRSGRCAAAGRAVDERRRRRRAGESGTVQSGHGASPVVHRAVEAARDGQVAWGRTGSARPPSRRTRRRDPAPPTGRSMPSSKLTPLRKTSVGLVRVRHVLLDAEVRHREVEVHGRGQRDRRQVGGAVRAGAHLVQRGQVEDPPQVA